MNHTKEALARFDEKFVIESGLKDLGDYVVARQSPEELKAFIQAELHAMRNLTIEECAREEHEAKEKEDLSNCKEWYENNACGSCGEIRGRENGWNACRKHLLTALKKM